MVGDSFQTDVKVLKTHETPQRSATSQDHLSFLLNSDDKTFKENFSMIMGGGYL